MNIREVSLAIIIFSLFTPFTQASTEIKAIVREVGQGQSLEGVIRDAGFTIQESRKLLFDKIIPKHLNFKPTEKYLVLQKPKDQRTEARFYLPYVDDALVFWRQGENVGVSRQAVDYKVVKKTFFGRFSGGLIESISRFIPDDWAAFRFFDAFSWDFDIRRKLTKQDSFKFTIEEKYDHDKFVKYGEITQAELSTANGNMKRILWETQNTKVFVDPDSRFEDRPFYAPIDYVHISSPFSRHRLHPVKRRYRPHLGVDMATYEGAPVYAARDGVLDEIARSRANGNFIRIKHDNGFFTIYNHLNRWDHTTFIGKKVKAGDVIGYVGCTGYCTSPHLHFMIRKGNYVYDPIYLTKPYPYKERDYWKSSRFKTLLQSAAETFHRTGG